MINLLTEKIKVSVLDIGTTLMIKKFIWYPIVINKENIWLTYAYKVFEYDLNGNWVFTGWVLKDKIEHSERIEKLANRIHEIVNSTNLYGEIIAEALTEVHKNNTDPFTSLEESYHDWNK